MLEALAVQRYRAFKARTRVELRPLTMLFGYNSAGKSTLLRTLPLLRDSLQAGTAPLDLGSAALRRATFSDVRCRLDPTPVVSLELDAGGVRTRYDIRDLPEQRRQIVERVTRSEGATTQVLEWTTEGRQYELKSPGAPAVEFECSFSGLEVQGDRSGAPTLTWGVPGAADLESVQWLDAIRARIRRRIPYGPRPSGALGADGSGAPSVLAYAALDGDPTYKLVRSFYREFLGHELHVEPVGDDFRLLLAPRTNPTLQIDLIDTGEGLGQALPVAVALAQAAAADAPALLALEQPELHLHPSLHEALTRWICGLVAGRRGPRVVLETHSENVLLTVLLALIDGELEPDDVIVYWIHQLDDGQSLAERVTFDDLARPQGSWPPEVFQEDAALAARLNHRRMELARS